MAEKLHDATIRRTDGSIDIEFYARRSAQLRREAIAAAPGVVARWLQSVLGRAGRAAGRSIKARRGPAGLPKTAAGGR
jgi:hypothetical protein